MFKSKLFLCLGLFFLVFVAVGVVHAQKPDVASVSSSDVVAQDANKQEAENTVPSFKNLVKTVNEMNSVLFTYWEYTALRDAIRARKLGGFTRAPTDAQLNRGLNRNQTKDLERVKPPPEKRYITLGGILYESKENWTIWLNNKRVTPNAIPEEVIDLKVFNDYIEIKWMDEWGNQIFPIRLRPHQRFNMDTRIFLPGVSG